MAEVKFSIPNLGALSGNKTYITLAIGALIIAANHYGLLPQDMVPNGLDPSNWQQDEFKLLLGATIRSAIAKAGNATGDQQKPTG